MNIIDLFRQQQGLKTPVERTVESTIAIKKVKAAVEYGKKPGQKLLEQL
jgi:hypothetical protein